jgi:hypothetical protein
VAHEEGRDGKRKKRKGRGMFQKKINSFRKGSAVDARCWEWRQKLRRWERGEISETGEKVSRRTKREEGWVEEKEEGRIGKKDEKDKKERGSKKMKK